MHPKNTTTSSTASAAVPAICNRDDVDNPFYDEELRHHPELQPPDEEFLDTMTRITLSAILYEHRSKLVTAARRRLGRRADAEDLVQDLCAEVLEGDLPLPVDPGAALETLLEAIAERCDEEGGEQ
jgi:DNA-directed RNA polymerase specialized sigma24 family protein